MPRSSLPLVTILLIMSAAVHAQVVAPVEIKDPALRALQLKYNDDLKLVGGEIVSTNFDFPFYLSRKLDLDESQQKAADQRSIRFDQFNGKTVLAITGNYYAAYSTEKMSPDQRARETFLKVVLPILKVAVPRFQNNPAVKGYALEISHHIIGKVMNVAVERPENLLVFLPQNAALKLLSAKDESGQQAALLEGQTLLNAQPVTIWLNGEGPRLAAGDAQTDAPMESHNGSQAGAEIVYGSDGRPEQSTPVPSLPKPAIPSAPPRPARDTSPEALASLQAANKEVLSTMLKELDPQAHFVAYAAPSFVAFRQGIYLELSLNSPLSENAAGSRYRMAAFAFDDHIAHLIRPVLGYLKDEPKFDGISFSTTLRLPGKATGGSEAVEFFFPFAALRCYEKYDCTGQQLIDAGTVLVNGERVGLDLEVAEGGSGR